MQLSEGDTHDTSEVQTTAFKSFLMRIDALAADTQPALLFSAATLAFFLQPAIRFVKPDEAWAGAAALGFGMVLARIGIKRADTISAILGCLMLFTGFGWLLNTMEDASRRASVNEVRCLDIEQKMLSAHSKRNDLPEVFSALGCVPVSNLRLQGE